MSNKRAKKSDFCGFLSILFYTEPPEKNVFIFFYENKYVTCLQRFLRISRDLAHYFGSNVKIKNGPDISFLKKPS